MGELDEDTDFTVLFTRNDFESIAFHMAPSGKMRQKVPSLARVNDLYTKIIKLVEVRFHDS